MCFLLPDQQHPSTRSIPTRDVPIRHWPMISRPISADNWRLTIDLYKKHILLSYLSYLFRLWLLSEDSYLKDCRVQTAEKTKMPHPKAKLQNAPTFTGNGSHSRVSTNDTHRCIHISVTCSPHSAKMTIGRYQRTNRPIPIIGKMANNRPIPIVGRLSVHL